MLNPITDHFSQAGNHQAIPGALIPAKTSRTPLPALAARSADSCATKHGATLGATGNTGRRFPGWPAVLVASTITLLPMVAQTGYAAVSPGSLRITEVMANPAAVSDTRGEWFELFNTTASSIDLTGMTISDEGSNNHVFGAVVVAAGGYLVLGRNDDPTVNGGVHVDYAYDNFTLANSSDAIILSEGVTVIDSLVYSDSALFGAAGNSAELTANGFALTPAEISTLATDVGTPGSGGSYTPPTASAVPLPAAGWFFASALGSLAWRPSRR